MNISFFFKLCVPFLWILLQNLLIIYTALRVLRLMGLLKRPVAGLEYSQAVMACILLLTMTGVGNVSVQACYDTYLNYSNQPGLWISKIMLQYSRYFLVVILFELLLVGLYWFVVKFFFGFRVSIGDTIAGGNLPLSFLMSGIVLGMGIGLGKLLYIVLAQMTPHFVLLNGV